eukprot:GFUD01025541.1.p1 GENE.GFUD01025541.1~~GFUD01025541.1.p1  ORF type:complete len:569 (+),score=204.49 GFUD01025541.1:71-1777(+)
MEGEPRPDLAQFGGDEILKHKVLKRCVVDSESSDSSHMEVGWGDDSGDDSLLYQATDIAVNKEHHSDSDMFTNSDNKIIPDTPSDEDKGDEGGEVNPDDVDAETGVLRGLFDDRGDDSLLNQATDIAVNKKDHSDSDMFTDSGNNIIPDTPSDEDKGDEGGDVNPDDVDEETGVLRGLLDEVGLRYKDVVSKDCSNTKGMVICNMTCKVDIKTELKCSLARHTREEAVLAAVRNITSQVRKKFFPDRLKLDEELCGFKQKLFSFCKETKKPEPQFSNWLDQGLYCASVRVGEGEVANSAGSFQVLAEAQGSAAKLWLNMFGGVKVKKSVAVSETFDCDLEEEEDTVSKENLPSVESFSSKEQALEQVTVESNRRPKKGGFFSSLDNMSDSELATAKVGSLENSTSSMKKAFLLLDKKKSSIDATRWSPKKEAAAIPRRSPRKQSKILNFVPTKKKELLRDVFDDSSCSVVSQSDPDSEEPVSPVKRPRSVSSEKVSAKKQKQEHEENADSKQRTISESLELAIYTSAKLQREKVSPAKNTEEKKRNREQGNPPTPPASKLAQSRPKRK